MSSSKSPRASLAIGSSFTLPFFSSLSFLSSWRSRAGKDGAGGGGKRGAGPALGGGTGARGGREDVIAGEVVDEQQDLGPHRPGHLEDGQHAGAADGRVGVVDALGGHVDDGGPDEHAVVQVEQDLAAARLARQ